MKLHRTLELIVAVGIALLVGAMGLIDHRSQRVDGTAASLKVVAAGTVETLDSTQYTSKSASQTIGTVISGLYARNAKGKIVPAMVKHARVSADKLTYTFTLRPYHWSNGQQVTAADYVYAWRRLADPATNSRNASRIDFLENGAAVRTGKQPVTALGVRALAKDKLQVKLAQANPYLTEILADTPMLPINEDFAEKWGKDYGSSATHILTSGPYRINGWSGAKDTTWRYVKNQDYYHQARVQVKAVDFKVETDLVKAAKQFENGAFDYTPLSPQQIPSFKGSRQLKTMATTTEALLFFNTTTGPTTNVELRKAIAQAYDKHDFTQSKLRNGGQPLNGLVPAGLVTMPQGGDYRAQTGQLMSYNLNKATAAWQRAKTQMGVNHLSLTLTIADNDTAQLVAEFIRSQLVHNLPGLNIKIQRVSLQRRVALEAAGKFELVFSTWSPADSDPLNLLAFYQTGSRLNITGFTDAKFDQLAARIGHAGAHPAKRMRLVQAAERYLMKTVVPAAGVFRDGNAYLLNHNVTVFPIMPTGSINFEYVRMH